MRQYGDQELASELAWLNAWTLEEPSRVEGFAQTDAPTPSENPDIATISQGPEVTETLSTFHEDALAWCVSNTDPFNNKQNVARSAVPSASLDATQLVDWFGTDLNTSTFDFDGNLQSMIQFFD